MHPIFQPTPDIHIATYLIIMSLAYTVSVIYFFNRSIKLGLSGKISTEISLVLMVGSFLGARIFHVLFEYPSYYWQHPFDFFKFYQGGFVFYGGLIGGALAAYFYIRHLKQNFRNWLDVFALVLPVGYMIGRCGCFFAGCCYGKECDLPWAVTFKPGVEAPAGVPLHPTQIYAILLEAMVWIVLYKVEKKKLLKASGSLFYAWMVLHGFARLINEHFRGDYRGNIVDGLSISFFLSLAMILGGTFLIYRQDFKKKDSVKTL